MARSLSDGNKEARTFAHGEPKKQRTHGVQLAGLNGGYNRSSFLHPLDRESVDWVDLKRGISIRVRDVRVYCCFTSKLISVFLWFYVRIFYVLFVFHYVYVICDIIIHYICCIRLNIICVI